MVKVSGNTLVNGRPREHNGNSTEFKFVFKSYSGVVARTTDLVALKSSMSKMRTDTSGTGPELSFHGAWVLELIPPVRSVLMGPESHVEAGRDEGAGLDQHGYRIAARCQVVAHECSWSHWRTAGTPGCHCRLRRSWSSGQQVTCPGSAASCSKRS